MEKLWPVVVAAYGINSILFFGTYFTTYAEESREYYNKDFMEAVAEADSLEEYESLYITGNLGWQFNRDATEILTQYVCKIDAQYYQGKSNVSNGRELPALRTGITTSIQSNRPQNWCRWWETACWYCIREICNTLIFPMM